MRTLIAALLFATPLHAATLEGKADVVDGDTIKIESSVVVRLQGIDTPEILQTCDLDGKSYECGKSATKALSDFVAGRQVRCELVGQDAFHRALGVCFVGGTEINAAMVRQGWALAFIKYSDAYSAQQEEAKAAKAGMWAGTFIKPWDWRLRKADTAIPRGLSGDNRPMFTTTPFSNRPTFTTTPFSHWVELLVIAGTVFQDLRRPPLPDGQAGGLTRFCAIKGNINAKGEHIYHTPSQQLYALTKIDATQGERWFCTEEEAQAAGWRRALTW